MNCSEKQQGPRALNSLKQKVIVGEFLSLFFSSLLVGAWRAQTFLISPLSLGYGSVQKRFPSKSQTKPHLVTASSLLQREKQLDRAQPSTAEWAGSPWSCQERITQQIHRAKQGLRAPGFRELCPEVRSPQCQFALPGW